MILIVWKKSRRHIAIHVPLIIGLSGAVITVWLFSVNNSRAATVAAIVVIVPTFASLALTLWQAISERDDLVSRANDLAGSEANEWEKRRLGLLGNYVRPADVGFARTKLDELVRYRIAGGSRKGKLTEVLEYFLELKPSRLVIVGAAGSGKTVLAIELLIALLLDRDSREQEKRRAVPVLLSLSSWDTQQSLQEWITSHLVTTYQMRRRIARRLIDGHWILPILDGLDEMDAELEEGHAAEAVRQLNAYASFNSLGPLVLTCREEQYLKLAGPSHQGIQDATVVHIEPLDANQITTYLSRRYPAQSGRRQVQDDWWEVCQRVKRYPRSSLALALSTPWRLTLAIAACDGGQILPSTLITFRTVKDFDDQLLRRFIVSAVTLSRQKVCEAEVEEVADRTERWLGRLATVVDQAGTDIVLQDLWKIRHQKSARWLHALVSVPGSAVVGLLGAEAADGSAGLVFALSCMTVGIGFGVWAAVDTKPAPSRISTHRLRKWPNSLFALTFGLVFGIYNVNDGGWVIGFTAWLLATLAGGILVGLRRGAMGVVRPGDPLKNDLFFGVTLGLAGGAWAALPGGFTGGLVTTMGIERGLGLWPSVLLALTLGIIGGISIGSRAWLRYVIALTLEAFPGHLPWRLNGALEWAYQAGLLRASGQAYQFRHDKFKTWLIGRYEAAEQSPPAYH